MGKKLVSRTAKVLSETKKSKDKEAVAIAYEHIPRDPHEQKHGSLYAVIEIEDKGGHAEELAETIIDTLHSEYYDDPDKESLTSFESALAKVNEALAEKTQEGQINWLGKLNAILAVLSENTLHLTQSGKAEAYLYRGDHALHVSDGLTGDSINPLRTFINVASGDLAENDRLAFVTPDVFLKISKDELKKYATATSPRTAIEDISKVLSGENGATLPNAVLVIEMVSPESFAAAKEPEVPGEAWVKEEKKTLEPVAEKTVKGAAKAFDLLGKAASGASAFIATKAIPGVKSGAGKISAKIKNFKKEKGAEQIILESEEKITPIEKVETKTSSELEMEEWKEGVLETPKEEADLSGGGEIRIKETESPKRLSLERFNFSFAEKTKDSFSGFSKKFRLPKGKNSVLYLIVGVVLIVGLFAFLGISSANNRARTAAENTYTQAKEKYNQAVSEIDSGQRAQGVEDLKIAEKLANDAKNSKYKKDDAEKLLSDISSAREKALGVVKNTAEEFADFGKGNLDEMFSDGTSLYGIKFSDGSVYKINIASKEVSTVVEAPKIDGAVKFAAIIPKRKVLVLYTDSKLVYEIDLVSKKVTKQTTSGEWEDAVAAAQYNNNLYLLSPSLGQVYKHVKSSSGYGKKTNYVSKPAEGELAGAIDIAIDSDVYTISADGKMNKYTAGVKKDYTINGLPESLSGVAHIFTDTDVKGQYIVAGDKIVRVDASQNFTNQYASDAVKDIKGIFVIDKSGLIYVLSGGKVYTIKL